MVEPDGFAFLGKSEMARLVAGQDWSGSLGPIADWPSTLKTTVSLMLHTPVPVVLLWGEDGVMIYNDAYSVFAGGRHPELLGSSVREGWPEVADFNDHVMKVGFAGGTLAYKDQELTLHRSGKPEQVWMNLDYSPVLDERGRPAGVIAIVIETTERVLAERRAAAERERQLRMLQQMPGFAAVLTGPNFVYEFVNDAYVAISERSDFIGRGFREVFPDIAGQGFFELLDRVSQTGQAVVTRDMELRLHGSAEPQYIDFVFEPIKDERGAVTGVFIGGYEITDAHRAQAALRESEARLRLALDAAAMGAFVWYPEEDRTEVDARMLALFGLPPGGALSLRGALSNRILPEDGVGYAAAVARALDPAGDGALNAEIRVTLPDGGRHWLAITAQVQFEGEPRRATRMVGAARDITASKLAEAALRESEARLRFLDLLATEAARSQDADEILAITTRMVGEHLNVSVCAYADMDEDEDGFTIRGDWSAPGSPSIVGHYSLADFGKLAVANLGAGRPLIINDNLKEIAPEEAATFRAIGITATICMPLVKEGRLTALMAIHHKEPHVWTAGELAVIREVTERSWAHVERVGAEAELRASEENFRTLARAMPNQAWTAQPDGQLDWFNERVYAYSGAEPGSLDGDAWVRIIHPEDLPMVDERWTRSLARGETYEAEFRLRRADGAWRWHLARAVPIKAAAGQVVRWIGTNTDIHDRTESSQALAELNTTLEERVQERTQQLIQAQDALRQAQKMEAVGQLTGGIAHDFNNLLAGISGSLELLERRLSEGRLTSVQRYIDAAQGAARRAAALTQRLLAFSRRQTLDPKPTDVNRLIGSMEDLIRRSVGPDIELQVAGPQGLWTTRVDPSQLENALLNLCINAR
ncbi:MAG: putative sensor/response regulator hybrid, partial [Phenylobacterium sp.]|nr:putative sensor/response regulator hybrid [Phenylobacterium sp.]